MDWIFVAMPKEAKQISKDKNVFVTGIGVSNVIKKISNAIKSGQIRKTDRIINVGYCGSKMFPAGTVLSISRVDKHQKPTAIKEPDFILRPLTDLATTCYTCDDFMDNIEKTGVVDMELFYLATFFPNIQSIKIVSDSGDSSEYKMNTKKTDSWKIVNSILERELK